MATSSAPPSSVPIARRHMSIAGVLTGCIGSAVPLIFAVLAVINSGGTGGDVADGGGMAAAVGLILSVLGIAVAAFAIFVGNAIRRGGESSRFWVSVLGPVAFFGGVALYPAEAAGSSFPVVSIVVAMYGAALIGLVVPAHIEFSARGEWLRRRGALSAFALSAIVVMLLAPAAVGGVRLIESAENRARLRKNTLAAQRNRCEGDGDTCLEGQALTNYCGHVASVAWSMDGAFVAAVGKRLRVWSVAPPQRIDASPIPGDFVAITRAPTGGPVVAVCRAWSCDVITPGDAAPPHSIIECSDGRLQGDAYPRAPLAFAPDGSRFVLAGDALCANELPSGRVVRQFGGGCANRYDAVAFSPDGKTVAAICNGAVTLWDPETGVRRGDGASRVLSVRSRSALAFSFDGRAVIVLAAEASSDVLYAFDAISGSLQTRVELGSKEDRKRSFAVLPNARVLVGGQKSCVWDLTSAKALGCVAARSDTLATSVGGTSSMVALVGTDMLAGADLRTDTQCPASTRTLKGWSSADLAALSPR